MTTTTNAPNRDVVPTRATPATPAALAHLTGAERAGERADRRHPAGEATLAVTHRRVIRSEWVKFWSVRSYAIGLLAAAVASIVLGLLISSVAGSSTAGSGGGAPPPGSGSDALSLSLAGFRIAQLVFGCLGVLVVSSEYSTGSIRSGRSCSPRNRRASSSCWSRGSTSRPTGSNCGCGRRGSVTSCRSLGPYGGPPDAGARF